MAKFQDWTNVGDGTVKTVPCKNPKKITGTRLGAIMGVNHWKSDFEAWCEISRVAELPFEGNKYTDAGTIIEPKIIEYCKQIISRNVKNPEEFYNCKDAKKHTGYDFFKSDPIFGGMWDGVVVVDGAITAVIECKTSSRPQDWENGVPEHYLWQGLLYAYMLGVYDVFFPVSFLEPEDYDNPENFVCTDENTVVYPIIVSKYPVGKVITDAMKWWTNHVATGYSPAFDEKKDKEILALMRTSEVVESSVTDLVAKANSLNDRIETAKANAGLAELEKELKKVKDSLRDVLVGTFTENDSYVVCANWKVRKETSVTIDKDALEADGLLEKYQVEKVAYKLVQEKGQKND